MWVIISNEVSRVIMPLGDSPLIYRQSIQIDRLWNFNQNLSITYETTDRFVNIIHNGPRLRITKIFIALSMDNGTFA